MAGTNNSFWHAFVFSVQTFSTVGYGAFSPFSDWAHLIVIIQSVLSVFVTALLTGLIFAKFSRPSARTVFSKNILINNFDGQRTLTLRMGNLRANQIAEAQVRMVLLKSFKTVEGQNIEVGISVIGYDSTFSQSIHANCIYGSEDVVFDKYFEDVFDVKDGKVVSLNYEKFNNLKL